MTVDSPRYAYPPELVDRMVAPAREIADAVDIADGDYLVTQQQVEEARSIVCALEREHGA